ncbi:hypothetical protein [Moorella sulfitireducens (nom. illeg.)]|uniref:hypothetical protein n=1 Tax=Neomoorella sulfitireducens TaxID=2972948 RepID=UPI0021AC2811|nr:hypothetical protein [Moorella sulfitireducens]
MTARITLRFFWIRKLKPILSLSAIAIVVLWLAFLAGCQTSSKNTPGQVPEKTKQALQYGDITDPVELERLWQEYFYDTIANVGNTRVFNSAQEIDPLNVARFCGLRYVAEHGKESLAPAAEGSPFQLLPLDIVLEYAERYFNLTSLDVSNIESGSYDPQKRAFIFNFGNERTRPSYNAVNSWGEHLDKVTRNSDGTVTAMLVRRRNDRIELTKTYTLKQREDGSLYFVSGRWEYVNNNLVSLTGDYQRYDKITGFDENLDWLSMLGEVDGRLILAYMPYKNTPSAKGENAALMLVNPETMTVDKKMEISGDFASDGAPTNISLRGDSIIIRFKDRFMVVDKTLTRSESVPLPKTIAAKINREPQYNAKGNPDVFFGGYDVASDRKRYVYADETGVKLFNATDNSEKLLSPTISITNSELYANSFHKNPRFVADEQKVITTMTGYEGAIGYTLCDLESGTAKNYRIASESSCTGLIRYDTGLLEVNIYLRDQENQTGDYKTMYLDFKTGGLQEISLADPGDTGYIRTPDYGYVGQNFAAFITSKVDNTNNANNEFYLNRLNLKTLQVEPKIITVKAAETHILGVLADGRIVFWYNLNPSENGVCITK